MSARDQRRVALLVIAMGLLFLLGGLALLTAGATIPWVLALCLVGWGVSAMARGIIQLLDSRRPSDREASP